MKVPYRLLSNHYTRAHWPSLAYGGHSNPFGLLTEVNVGFLKAALAAVTAACPLMEFWTLQTGGKGYGFEVLGQPGLPYHPPHKESSLPLPEPYGSMIFYNGQHAELASQAVGKSWTFCEIIPDLIIGHAPRANLMCFAQVMGLLLLLYAEIEGKGSQAIFPGPEAVYNALHSDTSQDISARLAIFSALHPNATAGQRYNIADQDEGVSFATLWPEVCAYFGLKGLGPDETIGGPKGAAWVLEHKSQWNAFETKHGLKQGIFESIPWPLLQASTKLVVFDRHYDLSKARALGFQEARPAIEGYKIAFQRLRTAKIIPH